MLKKFLASTFSCGNVPFHSCMHHGGDSNSQDESQSSTTDSATESTDSETESDVAYIKRKSTLVVGITDSPPWITRTKMASGSD